MTKETFEICCDNCGNSQGYKPVWDEKGNLFLKRIGEPSEKWFTEYEDREEFREYLRGKMQEITGVRDLEKANKRHDMLLEWRQEKDRCN